MAQGRAAKCRVKLTEDERDELAQVVRRGKSAGWKIRRAQALLKCDENPAIDGASWPDGKIAQAFGMTTRSVESWRKQAVERGPLSLWERKAQDRSKQRKLDGSGEAALVKLACSTPPEGCSRWTLRLLADELVALSVVDTLSYESVRRTLQKTRSSRGVKRCGASRPSKMLVL